MSETKTCKTCGETKELAAFEPRRAVCRSCRSKERASRKKKPLGSPQRAKQEPPKVITPEEPKTSQRASEAVFEQSGPKYPLKDPLQPLKDDFRKFLWYVWKEIGLPPPTPVQLDIAMFLQHGPTKIAIEAFRGVGKSFITSAYVAWELLRDPQKKILGRLGLQEPSRQLHHLHPEPHQRA